MWRELEKTLDAYVELEDGTRICGGDDLVKLKISGEGGLCRTVMKKCEIKFLGNHNLLGATVKLAIGVKLPSGEFEYINYGSFLITETTSVKDSNVTNMSGYDLMIHMQRPYVLQYTFPTTVGQFVKEFCNRNGIELASSEFVNSDLTIDIDLYSNIKGTTYRDVLQEVAEVSGTIAIIGNDDKLYFKNITDTGEKITYANLLKLKQEPLYGPINSLVLAREPQGDTTIKVDEESIEINGVNDFRIVNNEIVDKRREEVITSIFNALNGTKFHPFEADTEGLGWYEIGDRITIVNDAGVEYKTNIFAISLDMDGSLKEKLQAKAKTKVETDHRRAGGLSTRVSNTELVVDRQQNYISSLVSDMYNEDGIVNNNFTNVFQNIDNIVNAVQRSGGSNLIRNSVMFAFDNSRMPHDWEVEGNGTLEMRASAEARNNGSASGHIFILNDKLVRQRIQVRPDDENTEYTFTTKIRKNAMGSCYVKVFNDNEEYIIELGEGEETFYGIFELRALTPVMSYYDIEFYGSPGSNATFTDNMFAVGEFRTQWQQANGEIMNTQVNIDVNGVLVRSSVFSGNHTRMTPLGFEGHSMVRGISRKVFGVNGDITEMTRVNVNDELTMSPMKTVPVRTGIVTGWAFVPSE